MVPKAESLPAACIVPSLMSIRACQHHPQRIVDPEKGGIPSLDFGAPGIGLRLGGRHSRLTDSTVCQWARNFKVSQFQREPLRSLHIRYDGLKLLTERLKSPMKVNPTKG
jgi:hypothetical protein